MNINIIVCPSCGAENLRGEEECVECSGPLVELDKSPDRAERSFMTTETLEHLQLTAPTAVTRNTSLREAIEKMREPSSDGCVVVMDGDHVVGIVTERDLLYKVAGHIIDLDGTTVSAIMTADPRGVRINDVIAAAVNRMSVGGFRHLPVFKDNRIVGQVTMRRLLSYLSSRLPK